MAYLFGAKWVSGVQSSVFRTESGQGIWRKEAFDQDWTGNSCKFAVPDLITGTKLPSGKIKKSYSLRLADEISARNSRLKWVEHDLYWPDGSFAERRLEISSNPEHSFPILSVERSHLSEGKAPQWHPPVPRRIDDLFVFDETVNQNPIWQIGNRHDVGFSGTIINDSLAKCLKDKNYSGLYLKAVPEERKGKVVGSTTVLNDCVFTVHWPSNAVAEGWPNKNDLTKIRVIGDDWIAINRSRFVKYSDFELGYEVDETSVPTTWNYGSSRRKFPPIMAGGLSYTVSHEAKQIIEELEPNLHQFFGVNYVTRKGKVVAARWALNPRVSIDSLDRKRSDPARSNFWRPEEGYRREIFVDRNIVEGHHLWLEKWHRSLVVSYTLARRLAAIDNGMLSFGRFPLS